MAGSNGRRKLRQRGSAVHDFLSEAVEKCGEHGHPEQRRGTTEVDGGRECAQHCPTGKKPENDYPCAAEPPASDGQVGDEARDDAPTATQPDPQPVTCAECHETFPSVEAATTHCYATHGKAEEEPTE